MLAGLAALLGAAVAGCAGDGDTSNTDDEDGLSVAIPPFESTVPREYTCDGRDVSPPVRVEAVPAAAETLAVVVDDPDAPTDEPFVHWLLWNVPATEEEIPAEVPRRATVDALGGAAQGTNDFDELGYRGPCPPSGDGAHGYRVTVHAVGATLSVDPGATREPLASALAEESVAEATVTAEYERRG